MSLSKIKVYCAVPTVGEVSDTQTYFWRSVEKKYADKIEFIWPELCVRRVFHDAARNAHVEDFLKSGADVLFFLDSDVSPPTDLFDMFDKIDEWDCAGAPYPIFVVPTGETNPQVVFTAYRSRAQGGIGAAHVPKSGTEYIEGLATGCLFIKRHVIEQLDKPYFEFKYDKESRMMTEGEDLGFCRKVGDLGYKFYVDYSMVCRHYKKVCLLEVNNYALEYANKSVLKYDATIKPMIEQLAVKVKKEEKKPAIVPANNSDLKKIINQFRA